MAGVSVSAIVRGVSQPGQLSWNGKDLPPELRGLRPGPYVIQAVDDAPALTVDQEDGLPLALGTADRGDTVSADEVLAGMREMLRK
jgi:hypothetical protein